MSAPTWLGTWRARWREFADGVTPYVLALVISCWALVWVLKAADLRMQAELAEQESRRLVLLDLEVRQAQALERLVEILEAGR